MQLPLASEKSPGESAMTGDVALSPALHWKARTSRTDPASGVVVRALGVTGYVACWRAMQAFTDERKPDTPDEIWLTEHPPIYTLGLAGRRSHLRRENGIPVLKVDRGGQITFHGPGQLVAYLLFDIRRAKLGIREIVRRMEAAVIEWLGTFAIDAYGRRDAPGVYVRRDGAEAKIAALGLKVRGGSTYHGLAVNVAMDLAPFSDIDPCGFPGLHVTQLADCGIDLNVARAGDGLAPILARHLHASSSA